jgi:deazaflavin-dependent oxidoreductase (nitroreductase family)
VPGDRVYSTLTMAMGARGRNCTGKLNVPVYRFSGGRVGGRVGRAPVLLLTSIGRKSGQSRTAPMVYLADGEHLVVIDSNAGHTRTPAWSLNLKANPEAEVEVGSKRWLVRARIAEGEERASLWRRHSEQHSGLDRYETRANRDIAVFVLEPS